MNHENGRPRQGGQEGKAGLDVIYSISADIPGFISCDRATRLFRNITYVTFYTYYRRIQGVGNIGTLF